MKRHPVNPLLKCAFLCMACLTLAGRAGSSEDWERQFASPPPENRPWVYWFFMDGNWSREGLTADLEAMRDGGIGGAIILEVNLGIPQGPVQFMSPEWRQLFAHAVREGERLGIEIVLGSGPGWCGTGGPWVSPDQSMQHLVASETEVAGPSRFEAVLPRPEPRTPFFGERTLTPELKEKWRTFCRDVAVLAFPKPRGNLRIADIDEKALFHRAPYSSKPGVKSCLPVPAEHPAAPSEECVPAPAVVDLTGKMTEEGELGWHVPAGDWTILRFGRTVTGQITRPAPAPGLGFETDKFDPAAIDAHLEHYVGSLLKEAGPRKEGRGGLSTLHFDSWEMSSQNWSEKFREDFQRRRGYDPLPFLPAYTGRVVDSVETTERFLWDLRQTAQELVIEQHAGRLRDYAHRHGLEFSMEPYDMNPCADLTLGAVADVPMCEFWWKGFDASYSVIEAASIAHTGGRPIVAAESFTSQPGEDWQGYPWSLKSLGDWAFAAGVNRIVFHRYQHQPWLDRWPGMRMGPYGVHWERTQTWWPLAPSYHGYLARCQYLLRQGQAVADILFLAAEGAPHVFRAPGSATTGNPPDRRGYNFDGCSPETLLARAQVRDGRIVFPGGTSYRVLVLPETGTMTPALLRRIGELAQAGATVIGSPPRKSPSLSGQPGADEEVKKLAADIWETEPGQGAGRVCWGPEFSKEMPIPEPAGRARPLEGAKWIWIDDGISFAAAPVGRRHFRREIDLPRDVAIESAALHLAVDNRCVVAVHGQSAGSGDGFHRVGKLDLTKLIRPGANLVEVTVENGGETPNPAGFIGALDVRLSDGRKLRWQTDRAWLASVAPGPEAKAAREIGALGMAPWGTPELAQQEQLVEPLYPSYESIAKVLDSQGIPPDFESSGPIRYTHRTAEGGEIYFLANRSGQSVEADGVFRVEGRSPELWHPVTGAARALPEFAVREGRTTVPLRFEPLESYFVVFRRAAEAAPGLTRNFAALRPALEIAGPWRVSFASPVSDPVEADFEKLEDWTSRPEEEIRFFSGMATYRKTFDVPGEAVKEKGRVFLDLGAVRHLARVRLNGRDLGVVWCAPWRVDATAALRPGANELEITVANLWINRLIGDSALPEERRRTWTTRNPYLPDSPLESSGLLGPVTLQREVTEDLSNP